MGGPMTRVCKEFSPFFPPAIPPAPNFVRTQTAPPSTGRSGLSHTSQFSVSRSDHRQAECSSSEVCTLASPSPSPADSQFTTPLSHRGPGQLSPHAPSQRQRAQFPLQVPLQSHSLPSTSAELIPRSASPFSQHSPRSIASSSVTPRSLYMRNAVCNDPLSKDFATQLLYQYGVFH